MARTRAPTHNLLSLSDEVSRIAAKLAQLSANAGLAPAIPLPTDLPEPDPMRVRREIRARQRRLHYFDSDLFAEPAWDMLLDLLDAELMGRVTSVTSLCLASGAPNTTALRWVSAMEDKGLIMRSDDRSDGRRKFVTLTPGISRALRRYFVEVLEGEAA